LAIGILIATSGGGEPVTIREISTTTRAAPTTTRVLNTTPLPLPSNKTTSTTTSTTSTTSTSTLPPVPAVADAGEDLAVDAGGPVMLAAIELSDHDQSVVWRQISGPDVTDGRGRLIGAEVMFVAPIYPTTLLFDVIVTGRGGDVAKDDLRIDVYEQADRALFVDGLDGTNDGDGSRELPLRDLSVALAQAERLERVRRIRRGLDQA
jgi:hypothetical protein